MTDAELEEIIGRSLADLTPLEAALYFVNALRDVYGGEWKIDMRYIGDAFRVTITNEDGCVL